MVDGGRGIEFLKRLPTSSEGYKFELQSRVVGVYDKGKAGTVVASSTDFVDTKTGDVYARITANHFYVGQGGWGGPKGVQCLGAHSGFGYANKSTRPCHGELPTSSTQSRRRLRYPYNSRDSCTLQVR